MSAAKRPLLSSGPDNATRRTKSRVASAPRARRLAVNALSALNTVESPFLRLPAELRNRIYEFVFTVNLIHVEHEDEPAQDSPWLYSEYGSQTHSEGNQTLAHSGYRKLFRFYLCKADKSEQEAYLRSIDTTLDERVTQAPDTDPNAPLNRNHWRMGDRFHVDSCKGRHQGCIRPPRPPRWLGPSNTTTGPKRQPVKLTTTLSLPFLRVCAQIHTETNILPFALNTFSFRQGSAFLHLLSSLPPCQAHALRELTFSMTAGHNNADATLCSHWNTHLFMPAALLARLSGLRILHISIAIDHHQLDVDGPLRASLANPSELDGWVIGLERLRGLALDQVTVVVADDPSAKFGIYGVAQAVDHLSWHSLRTWGAMREAECFTAGEKRWWAERIRARLMMRKSGDTRDTMTVASS